MDDHFDTSGVFEISKFDIAKFCIYRGRTKLENLSLIVFHTVLLKKFSNMAKIKICDFISV